jgi:cysteine desulfurase
MIYLDHAATSPLRPVAKNAMAQAEDSFLGNPTGAHSAARRARGYLEQARQDLADILGLSAKNIIFTSGGSESDNLAIKGLLAGAGSESSLIISAIEHRAVLNVARSFARESGINLIENPVDKNGLVDLDFLRDHLDNSVKLVSIMAVNNEIGTIQRLKEVREILNDKAPEALFHTDAVQGALWLPSQAYVPFCDLISLGAHKLGGPVGIGALVFKDHVKLRAIIEGGSQENYLRAGTQNVLGAVGFAAAFKEADELRTEENQRLVILRDLLLDKLCAKEVCDETVRRQYKVAGNAHVLVKRVDPEELMWLIDENFICLSAGSSCASGALEPSHVLNALQVSDEYTSALRMTLGWNTKHSEVTQATEIISNCIDKLLVS